MLNQDSFSDGARPAAPMRSWFSRCENSAHVAAGRRKIQGFQHAGTLRRS